MSKVFLTGASGFIAKHVLRELLDKGYQVRASIRSEKRKAEIQTLFPNANIEFAFLDLTQDKGWADAMNGCDVLMHTASPFPFAEPKNPQDLIRPAVDGTLRALKGAKAAGIKRVILTSSNAAIYKEASKPIDAPSTELNWTTPEHPSVSAYEASKTLAEKAAWDFVAENPEISLTTINPGGVFGPAMDGNYGTSLEIIEQLITGKVPVAPPMSLPIVDVRDVAMMHVAAISLEAAKGQRFSATTDTLSFLEIANIVKLWDSSAKTPKSQAPAWLMKFLALFMSDAKTVVPNIGRNLSVSGEKAQKTFDFTFISAKDSIFASAESIKKFS